MSDEMPWSELAHDERFGPGRLVDGRYVIMRELRVPLALGRLFQCSTLPLGRQVLLSLAPSAQLALDTPQQRRYFLSHVRQAALVRHAHLATIQDFGLVGRQARPFLVMDWMEGELLHHRITQDGAMHPARAFRFGLQLADAVAAAHARALVHGSLSTATVFLSQDRQQHTQVRLLQLGLKAWGVMGQEGAPGAWEQALRADVSALGEVITAMFTGAGASHAPQLEGSALGELLARARTGDDALADAGALYQALSRQARELSRALTDDSSQPEATWPGRAQSALGRGPEASRQRAASLTRQPLLAGRPSVFQERPRTGDSGPALVSPGAELVSPWRHMALHDLLASAHLAAQEARWPMAAALLERYLREEPDDARAQQLMAQVRRALSGQV